MSPQNLHVFPVNIIYLIMQHSLSVGCMVTFNCLYYYISGPISSIVSCAFATLSKFPPFLFSVCVCGGGGLWRLGVGVSLWTHVWRIKVKHRWLPYITLHLRVLKLDLSSNLERSLAKVASQWAPSGLSPFSTSTDWDCRQALPYSAFNKHRRIHACAASSLLTKLYPQTYSISCLGLWGCASRGQRLISGVFQYCSPPLFIFIIYLLIISCMNTIYLDHIHPP